MPEPVPPPSEWHTWKPVVQQQAQNIDKLESYPVSFVPRAGNASNQPHLADNRTTQPPSGQRPAQSRSAQRLRCSDPLPSCFPAPVCTEWVALELGAKTGKYPLETAMARFQAITCPKMKLSGRKTCP